LRLIKVFRTTKAGWSDYASPGIHTFSQRLKKFEALFEEWSLAQGFVCI